MSEETTQEQPEETTPAVEEATTVETSGTETPVESEAAAAESPDLSTEEIAGLQALKQQMADQNITDPSSLMRDYTQTSQMRADQARLLEQQSLQLQQFQQVQQQRQPTLQDQLAQIDAALLESDKNFDAEKSAQLRMHSRNLERQMLRQDALQAAQSTTAMSRGFDQASDQLGGTVDQAKLGEFLKGTANPDGKMLAALEVGRRFYEDPGSVREMLNRDTAERKAKAAHAANLGASVGSGSGGHVPGADRAEQAEAPFNLLHHAAMSKAGQKRVYGDRKPPQLE